MSETKASIWLRAVDVITGLIAIGLAVVVLTYQSLAVRTLVFILSIALLVVGFARVAVGIRIKHLADWLPAISTGAGLLAVILAIVALLYPQLAIEALIFLLAFALLLHGIARIVVGGFAKVFPRWLRGLLVVVGLLTISLAVTVLVYPALGQLTLVLLLSVTFLIIGIEGIVLGIKGTRRLEH